MKLLVAIYPRPANHPHFFKPAHLQKIRRIVKGKMEIRVASDRKEIEEHAQGAAVIAGFPSVIPPIARLKPLKWAQSFSAGVDKLLTPEVAKLPLILTSVSGIHATPIAEHVIGFMLIFTRRFHEAWRNQNRHLWEPDETLTELKGKTILIAGLGSIGSEVARLSHSFGARVIAVSRGKIKKPSCVDLLKSDAYLNAFLPQADFVCICLPHTKDTHHLFCMAKFRRMKRTAVLINIGRGGIVNEKELVAALKKKIIGGAALDVTEQEPLPPRSPLWKMEHVIITPHQSGLSEKYMDRAVEILCDNLKRFLAKKPLKNAVNKKLGY